MRAQSSSIHPVQTKGGSQAGSRGQWLLMALQACVVAFTLLLVRLAMAAGADDDFFGKTKSFGEDLLNKVLYLSGMGVVLGFILAGQAFSGGDIERGKTMLKGTLIGSVCICGSVTLVRFIQTKFNVTF